MDTQTAQIHERVPLKLRNEYDAAWSQYGAVCAQRAATAQERAEAYERARLMDDKLQTAIKAAAAEHKRFLQRNAQHT